MAVRKKSEIEADADAKIAENKRQAHRAWLRLKVEEYWNNSREKRILEYDKTFKKVKEDYIFSFTLPEYSDWVFYALVGNTSGEVYGFCQDGEVVDFEIYFWGGYKFDLPKPFAFRDIQWREDFVHLFKTRCLEQSNN